jgi:hypothetical protein
VIVPEDGGLVYKTMRWGLVPFCVKIGSTLINARLESAPAFRSAWKERRCLIPASGHYEWQAVEIVSCCGLCLPQRQTPRRTSKRAGVGSHRDCAADEARAFEERGRGARRKNCQHCELGLSEVVLGLNWSLPKGCTSP